MWDIIVCVSVRHLSEGVCTRPWLGQRCVCLFLCVRRVCSGLCEGSVCVYMVENECIYQAMVNYLIGADKGLVNN